MKKKDLSFITDQANNKTASPGWLAVFCIAVIEGKQ